MHTPPIEVDAGRQPPLGMAPGLFLRDYWQKRPLLLRNAFPGLVAPLQPEDLAGLACEDFALSRLVEHDRAGDRWTLRTGPFEEALFPTLPQRDWTLLVQDVDKWDADVRGLLAHFAFLPSWRIDDVMVSYAAPGGSVGAHVDHYDVFLLQGAGHRRWQLSMDPTAPQDVRDDTELRLLRSFSPTHDWILGPGDMLYLPPGIPHHGVAEDACLTFSIGMRAPSTAEMLVDFFEERAAALPERDRYADPDLQPSSHPGEIDAAAVQRVLAALHPGTLDQAQVTDWFGRFISRYRLAGDVQPPPGLPSPAALDAQLRAGGELLRHPFARFAFSGHGDAARLFANGESLPCPAPLASTLSAPSRLDGRWWAGLDARARDVVHDLLARGLLLPHTDD